MKLGPITDIGRAVDYWFLCDQCGVEDWNVRTDAGIGKVTKRIAMKMATDDGWRMRPDGSVICPACVEELQGDD